MKEITITILTSNDEDVVKEVRKNLMELHWKMRKDICHTKIKVKNKPSGARNIFSSISPISIVGSVSKTLRVIKLRYFGFCPQCLFNKIRFSTVVSA